MSWLIVKIFSINQEMINLKQIKILEKLKLVKELMTQLVAYYMVLYSKENYKMIAIDLSKQQALDFDPRAI